MLGQTTDTKGELVLAEAVVVPAVADALRDVFNGAVLFVCELNIDADVLEDVVVEIVVIVDKLAAVVAVKRPAVDLEVTVVIFDAAATVVATTVVVLVVVVCLVLGTVAVVVCLVLGTVAVVVAVFVVMMVAVIFSAVSLEGAMVKQEATRS